MSYSKHSHHPHCHAMCGITAPYCPPPACPPAQPMPCMDCCPSASGSGCAEPPLHKASPWPKPIKPCPPPHQSGVVCPKPPMKPVKPKCESVLLQKIVSCEKRYIPQLCAKLELACMQGCPPYRLLAVHQSGAQPWWTPVECQTPDARQHIRVSIPVCCQVCDGEGRTHQVTSVVEAEVSYRSCENKRSSLFIVPCVRLAGGDVCSDDACFCVQLEIELEIYLLRPEPCAMHRPEPACPELPLYPIPPQWHRHGGWETGGWLYHD